MPRADISEARRTAARELLLLERVLQQSGLCPVTGPLSKAANQCMTGTGLKPQQWGYRVDKLLFYPQISKRTVPQGVYALAVELTVDIVSSHWNDAESADPFDTLEFNIILRGEYKKNTEPTPVFLSWHLDRHIDGEDEGDENENNQPASSFIHPLYHFQLGGKRLWDSIQDGFDYGSALILETPRIAHPPMDAILGVDFVLTNYFPQILLGMREDGRYQNILTNAQKRCWRPYVHGLIAAWKQIPQSCTLKFCDIWPQIPEP